MDPYLQTMIDRYNAQGPEEYNWLEDLNYQELDPNTLAQLQESGLGDITTNPEYDRYMMAALQDLERQSQEGFTPRDEADMARIEGQNRRSLRGAEGAIRQNMAARGIGGSGLEFLSRQQAAQDAADRQALSGLEKMAQMNERKQSAASRLGQLGSQFQGQQFSQEAQKAAAQDAINRFNTGNRVDTQVRNNMGRNEASRYNNAGRQGVSGQNTQAKQQQRDTAMQMEYNARVEDMNRKAIEDAEKRRRKAGMTGAILGAAGAGIGAAYGGPMGAGAGYSVGSGLGNAFAAHGGEVTEDSGLDNYDNDTKMMFLSPGEIVIPKSKTENPIEAAKFVAKVNDNPMGSVEARNNPDEEDVVGSLLAALSSMHRRRPR